MINTEIRLCTLQPKVESSIQSAKINQIPYDYTVEVTNRFKGFDLIYRVPEELWTEVHDIVQEVVIKTIPKGKKKKVKRQNGSLRRPYK